MPINWIILGLSVSFVANHTMLKVTHNYVKWKKELNKFIVWVTLNAFSFLSLCGQVGLETIVLIS